MTIKYPDCSICGNRGYNLIAELAPNTLASTRRQWIEREVACSCAYGSEWQKIADRMAQSDYKNPFLTMTDEQVLATLDKASKDQEAVEAEFNES